MQNSTNKIKVVLVDFAYTLCFPKNTENVDSLNGLYQEIMNSDSNINALDKFILNRELLNYFQTIKSNQKIYIFTSGTMHTDLAISQVLSPIFDGYITSMELKMPKSFPNSYKLIANKLDVNINEILFIDDQQKNVDAAITAGAQAIRYVNNATIIQSIKKIIGS